VPPWKIPFSGRHGDEALLWPDHQIIKVFGLNSSPSFFSPLHEATGVYADGEQRTSRRRSFGAPSPFRKNSERFQEERAKLPVATESIRGESYNDEKETIFVGDENYQTDQRR